MPPKDKVHIVGIGDDGLDGVTAAARTLIEQADLLVGADYTLRLVPAGRAERLVAAAIWTPSSSVSPPRAIDASSCWSRAIRCFMALARYLCEKLGKDRFEVVPHVSSMQLAFARVKESWEEAYLTNLANRPLDQVLEQIRVAEQGRAVHQRGLPAVERGPRRCSTGRSITSGATLREPGLARRARHAWQLEARSPRKTFAPLNVMILVRKPDVPDRPAEEIGRRLFGNPDEAFLQSKPKQGLLTTSEVRSIALAQLDLRTMSTVWDIGAGSGSVAIEAAQIASGGKTYAIEMDQEDHALDPR